jgi:hypothetical protein
MLNAWSNLGNGVNSYSKCSFKREYVIIRIDISSFEEELSHGKSKWHDDCEEVRRDVVKDVILR